MSKEMGFVEVYSPTLPQENVTAEDKKIIANLQDVESKLANGQARQLDKEGTVFAVARETGKARFGRKKRFEIDTVVKSNTALLIEGNAMHGKFATEADALNAMQEYGGVKKIKKAEKKAQRKAQEAEARRAMYASFRKDK